jgi:hypothetical protein
MREPYEGSMSQANARRDQRYRIAIPVTIVSRDPVTVLTENVSFRGMFLRTDNPPPRMHLIRVRIALPNTEIALDTNVVVVSSSLPGARAPGVGVTFFALNGDTQKEWETFISTVRDQQLPTTSDQLLAAAASRIGASLRAMPILPTAARPAREA